MTTIIRFTLTFASISLLCACSTVDSLKPFDHEQAAHILKQNYVSKPTRQAIVLHLPNKKHWQRIDVSYKTIGTPIMLIPYDEDRNHWHESIRSSLANYIVNPNMTPEQFVAKRIKHAKTHCSVANATILKSSTQMVAYQLVMKQCDHEPDQLQIGKAMSGADAIYHVYYSVLASPTAEMALRNHAGIIESARLVNNPRYVPLTAEDYTFEW